MVLYALRARIHIRISVSIHPSPHSTLFCFIPSSRPF